MDTTTGTAKAAKTNGAKARGASTAATLSSRAAATPAANALQVGMAVQLPSGGPAMTVVRVAATEAACIWFHEGKIQREHFPIEALVPAPAGRGK